MTLAWLRLRTWLGWGAPPEANRQLGRDMVLASIWTLVFPPVAVVGRALIEGRSFNSAISIRAIVILVVGFSALFAPLWLAGLARLWLAARGTARPLVNVDGRCFATLLSPSFYFARIGPSAETARWYALPLTWDVAVAPGPYEFELSVNPTTEYVERLRRLGAAPAELRQELDANRQRDETDTGKSTRAQRRELYRRGRHEKLSWAIDPADVVWTAWTFIVSGVIFGPGWLLFAAYFLLTYPVKFGPGGKEAGIVFLSGFLLLGLALIAGGLYLLRVWQRLRRLSSEPPVTLEGSVQVWTPYHNLFSSGKGALVELQVEGGTHKVFLVPKRWQYRIEDKGNRVAVTFVPGTGRVLDVRVITYAEG